MEQIANRSRGKSLADVGYVRVGLDDNWQDCGAGVNGSFHDSTGQPLVNLKTFPDMKSMVSMWFGCIFIEILNCKKSNRS